MKKLLLMVCALFGFMACTQNPIEEQSAIRTDAPETIRVGFEDNETRIQLNEAQKTVWTKGDQVSVFYKSDANQKWEYRGETGERIASLYCVDAGSASRDMDYVVLAYPYSSDYVISTATGNIETTLPATQHYAAGSYGVGENLMVSRSEFTQFSLKSVCGWLKLQLTGNGEVVKSIKFRGNNGEQVAGLIYVDTATAEATLASEMGGTDDNNAGGNLVFNDTILTEVTLDCGAGVELGAEATSFYISLPPQTFENGFTVEIESDGYKQMTLSTENELVIERNTIQPMASVKVELESIVLKPANNEIWYTNDSTTEPTNTRDAFDVNIVSNTYDAEKECWVIKFDGDVITIGEYAFHRCYDLTSITIPDSVTTIGYAAFRDCSSLTSITIPDSVTTIGYWAFDNCDSLTSVTIPDSVISIGDYAFLECLSLREFRGKYASEDGRCLIIDGTLKSFAPAGLTTYSIPDSVTTIGEEAFYICSSLTSVTIPDGVTTIGNYAFYNCCSLTSITIGNSVTTIGDYAFQNCSSLTSITIPDSVTTIGYGAFWSCSSLTSITIPDSVTSIENYVFYGCSSLTSVTIPDGVTIIGDKAFYDCSSLTSVTIPDSVTTIGWSAFQLCRSLTSITILDSVTTIGDYAFAGCNSLTSITIPDSVTTIGDDAFWSCSSLKSVTIPDSVTRIGRYAFDSCTSLTSVYISDLSAWCRISFESYSANPLSYAKNLYLNNELVTDIVIPSDITEIKNYAFSVCSSLTSVTIGDSVTEIGDYVFCDCDSLTSITIGNSVTTIGEWAFALCRSLTSVTIGDSVTTIGNDAFRGCSSLTSVTIPNSVTTIGEDAFTYCSSLTSVTIPDSVTTIGYGAFEWCESLTSVYCEATTPPAGGFVMFSDNASGRKIYVPMESVEAYKSAKYWKDYADDIVGYDF